MLRVPYLGSTSLRSSSSIRSCQPNFVDTPRTSLSLHSTYYPRLMTTRTLSQSTESPATTVEVIGRDEQKILRKIEPSYPDKPKAIANLIKNLFPIHLVEGPTGTAYKSHGWELNPTGNIISRLASFDSEQHLKRAKFEIDHAASELNHHPTIFLNAMKTTPIPYMLIACTTHSPPGLSVKDAKLAQRVDEILNAIKERDDSNDERLNAEELSARRKEAWAYIESKIADGCACANEHGPKPA